MFGPVLNPGVHDGDGGVGARLLQGQQQRQRAAQGRPPPHDDHGPSCHGHLVMGQHGADAEGRARPGMARLTQRQVTEVDGVQAVDVFGR